MIEAIEVATYQGKVICAFPDKEECKKYMKENHPEIDGFDVILTTQYLSTYKPGGGYLDR